MSNRYPSKDPVLQRAIQQILGDYGDEVSVTKKNKSLLKFGRNSDVGTTTETVWRTGGIEVYPTGNNIDTLVSTSGSDTGTVTIEGHTMSGGLLTFVVQTATLTGITPVTLTTPLFRATRIYNTNSADFAGIITVTDTSEATTHLTIPLDAHAHNQSQKCATSLSQYDYWIITSMSAGVEKTQSRSVEFDLQVREYGKVFRTVVELSANSQSGSIMWHGEPYIIVKPNSDVRMIATSSGTATEVSGWINGHLAIIL